MTRVQRGGLLLGVAYLVFWIGGNYSFDYTHTCVRSHQEEQVVNDDGDTETVTICDWYSANTKRWTFGDPARAVLSVWITGWTDAAVLGAIGTAIGIAVWRDRRKTREREAVLERYRSMHDLD